MGAVQSPSSKRARLRLEGLAAGTLAVATITAIFIPFRGHLAPASPALALVLPAIAAAVRGGRVPAVVTGFLAAASFSFVFIPPYDSYKIAVPDDAVALAVFILVALASGTLAAREAERRRAAEERTEEIHALYQRYEAVAAEREQFAVEAHRVALMERVDEQRSALLRSVSHDLRTPLATIRAVASDLRAGPAFDDTTRDELLELVADEAERLDRIVENLLSLSRIESGALQPDCQAIALDELITDRIRRMGRLFQDVDVESTLEPGLPFVEADYVQLDLVVTNLLENASRYAPPRSTVEVRAVRDGDFVAVSVADHGPGIPAADLARVFDPFRSGRDNGSGVGLAICRAVVEAHGGEIDVASDPGAGARFTFTIPIRRD